MDISQVNIVTLTEDNTRDICAECNSGVIDDIKTTIDRSIIKYIPLYWLDHKTYYDSLVSKIVRSSGYDNLLDTLLEIG